jgi:hypothetical protein
MKRMYLIGMLSVTALSTGCASIVSGTNQSISVETRNKGMQVTNANCKLSNDKGNWFVTTPGSVVVNRSYNDLSIRCEKDGVEPGLLTAKSFTKGMAFGNILFGGFIGAGVDMASGAAYDYPSLFTIEMGQTLTIVPPVAEQPRAEAPQSEINVAN